MNLTFAKIGITLSVTGIPAFLIQVWLLFPIWNSWHFSGIISYLTWHLLMDGPILAQTIAGLTFYVIGRKSFWEEADWGDERILIFGIILVLLGWFFSRTAFDGFEDAVNRPIYLSMPLNLGEPFASTLPIIWASVFVITGVLWIVDFAHLSRISVVGAMLATISFLAFYHMTFSGNVTKPAGLGMVVFLAFGSVAFSSISIALALSTLAGTVMVTVSFLKKTWEEWY